VTYIFVSYASADREFVARLIPDLQHANITVWIDQLNLKTGTPDWEQALRSAISQACKVEKPVYGFSGMAPRLAS
jgi:hypothetical protein